MKLHASQRLQSVWSRNEMQNDSTAKTLSGNNLFILKTLKCVWASFWHYYRKGWKARREMVKTVKLLRKRVWNVLRYEYDWWGGWRFERTEISSGQKRRDRKDSVSLFGNWQHLILPGACQTASLSYTYMYMCVRLSVCLSGIVYLEE